MKFLLGYLLMAGLLASLTSAARPQSMTKCCKIRGRLPVCEFEQQLTPLCCPPKAMSDTEVWVYVSDSANSKVALNATGHFQQYVCVEQPTDMYLRVYSFCYSTPVDFKYRRSSTVHCEDNGDFEISFPKDVFSRVKSVPDHNPIELAFYNRYRNDQGLLSFHLPFCCWIRGHLPICKNPQQKTPLCCPSEKMDDVELTVWDYRKNGYHVQKGVPVDINYDGSYKFYTCIRDPKKSTAVFLQVKSNCYGTPVVRQTTPRQCRDSKTVYMDQTYAGGYLFYKDPTPKENLNDARYCALRKLLSPATAATEPYLR